MDIGESIKKILYVNLKVKQKEIVLVVIDNNYKKIGKKVFDFCVKMKIEADIIQMKEGKVNGEEPPQAVAEAMKKSDVVLLFTKKSLTHTKATLAAVKAGARVASMPGILESTMARALSADIETMDQIGKKIYSVLNKGNIVEIKSGKGADVCIDIKGRNAIIMNGKIHGRGSMDNLPGGEVSLSPAEGKSKGVVVFDGSCAGVGLLKKPINVVVDKGYATKITGGAQARKLDGLLKPLGKKAYNIAELGFGTNEKAKLTGSVLEDEKILGTVHIALGNNAAYGGNVNVPIHLDGVIIKPSVWVDGKQIMDKGRYLF